MLSRLRGSLFDLERRVSAVGSSFVDMFLRDNKVIPVVLALLALLVLAWIIAGAFLGGRASIPVPKLRMTARATQQDLLMQASFPTPKKPLPARSEPDTVLTIHGAAEPARGHERTQVSQRRDERKQARHRSRISARVARSASH